MVKHETTESFVHLCCRAGQSSTFCIYCSISEKERKEETNKQINKEKKKGGAWRVVNLFSVPI